MPPHRRHGAPGTNGPSARCRWWNDLGRHWEVRARLERFVEPSLLLLLRDGETHGYELADSLSALVPDDPVDMGNLYRLLRSLEDEGLVRSRWRDDQPGRAKRTYELTEDGARVLDAWAAGLRKHRTTIEAFLHRYETPSKGQPS